MCVCGGGGGGGGAPGGGGWSGRREGVKRKYFVCFLKRNAYSKQKL